MPPAIPVAVAAVVGEFIGNTYSHRAGDQLFRLAGAPGDPPELSHGSKWKTWLLRANATPNTDAHAVLGRVIEEFMEVDPAPARTFGPDHSSPSALEQRQRDRARLRELMVKYGLDYAQGGKIRASRVGTSTRALETVLRDRDLDAVNVEFERALKHVEDDPPAAVTSACAIVEALCKVYIQDESLEMPSEQTIKPLWKTVQKALGLDPAEVADDDLKRILSGLASIVDGIGAFRTHVGSAHGRGRKAYRPAARHAKLAIHSAHSLVTFMLETWDERKSKGPDDKALQTDDTPRRR